MFYIFIIYLYVGVSVLFFLYQIETFVEALNIFLPKEERIKTHIVIGDDIAVLAFIILVWPLMPVICAVNLLRQSN